MLVISVDPFEFENASSEESLEIAVAARGKRPFSTVEDFIASRLGVEASRRLPTPDSFQHMHGLAQVIAYLSRFASIAMPAGCEWSVYRLSHEWDEENLVLCTPDKFIHYLWRTSA